MKPLNQYPKHKRKKIEYIRQKFILRNGGIVRSYFKISKGLTIDLQIDEIELNIHEILKDLFSTWKLVFTCIHAEIGLNDNDFLNDLKTVILSFTHFPSLK